MKDSGIEWIGEIPVGWEIRKVTHIFDNIGSGTTPKSSNESYYVDEGCSFLQTGDLNDGIIERTSKYISEKALEECSLKIYPKGSLVIAMYGATIGKLGLLNIEAATNQACCVLSEGIIYDKLFSFYVFFANCHNLIMQANGGGQPNISQEIIKREKLPVPHLLEQQKIANHLDTKCAEIDNLISLQEEMIAELKAYKQSVITEAVCKGLDKNVPMKDSGIEWIGEIPEHWKVYRLKYYSKNHTDKANSPMKYVGLENIISFSATYIETESQYDISQAILCNPKDVLFGKLRPYLAKVYEVEEPLCCSSEFVVFGGSPCSTFLKYILISDGFLKIVDASTYGTKMPRASVDFIRNMLISVPPLSEQQTIANYLDKKCANIDQLISIKQQKADELKEYKKSMIYEYVTGKKEVI